MQFQAGPAGQITTNEGCAKAVAKRIHADIYSFQYMEILLRRGNHIHQQPLRLRTHCGKIAQHAPRSLVADPLRLFKGLEMDAFDNGIGSKNLICSRAGNLRHGAVIARTGSEKRMSSELRSQAPDSFVLADFTEFFHARMINLSYEGNNPSRQKP